MEQHMEQHMGKRMENLREEQPVTMLRAHLLRRLSRYRGRPLSRRSHEAQRANAPLNGRGRAGLCLAVATMAALGILASCAPVRVTRGAATPHPSLQGTLLGGTPAPAVQLRDQTGALISLAQFHGHPVVLTFMDSYCTTQCPITAQYINYAVQLLGSEGTAKVDWVAISLNPWQDTPTSVQAFLTKNHLSIPIHWLMGTQAQLTPIWNAYHMQVIYSTSDIEHTVGTYLIDGQGREQVFFDEGFDPKQMADDLRILLGS